MTGKIRYSPRVAAAALGALALLWPARAPLAQASPTSQALPDVSGHWVQLQVTTSRTDLPVLGDVISQTVVVVLLEIEQREEQLVIDHEVCSIEIESTSKRVRTILPPAFVRGVSGARKRAQLEREAGMVWFYQPPTYVIHGAEFEDEQRDTMPEDDDDPRLRDGDGDGKPAMTVLVRGLIDGEIYVVQRSWNELRGEVAGADRIDGLMRWSSQQGVVGATSIVLSSPPKSLPYKIGDARRNYFRMRRVDADTSCAAARRFKRELKR